MRGRLIITSPDKTVQATPFLIKLGLLIAVFGFLFPIYGIPLGVFKLTFWRAGIVVLLPLAVFYNLPLKVGEAKIASGLVPFALLAIWRLLSLVLLASDKSFGKQQLTWFIEGCVFLVIVVLLQARFKMIFGLLLRDVFYVGLVSIAILAVQFILIRFYRTWTLPLSTSIYGISEEQLSELWTYPLYGGGRVIGAFWEPNMSGSMCAYYFALFFPFVFIDSKSRFVSRWLLFAAILAAIVAVIGTGSRQSVLAILISFALIVGKTLRSQNSFGRRRMVLVIVLLVFPIYLGSRAFSPEITTVFGETPLTVFDRFSQGAQSGDLTGGRWEWYLRAANSITVETVIFGDGEGTALGLHNAYLNALIEGGIVSLSLLVYISLSCSYRLYVNSNQKHTKLSVYSTAGLGVFITWVVLIFANGAQLNQSISYLYLSFSLLSLGRSSIHGGSQLRR